MQAFERLLVTTLCICLCAPPMPAQEPAQRPRTSNRDTLQSDERILQALNRFTFGPRPGDVEAVKAMGLDRWFQQQLHPASINEFALNQRLTQFPAMTWSSQDLLFRLPSNAVIRQVVDGKLGMPEAGALHHVYANQAERVEFKRQQDKKKQEQAATPTSMNGMMAAANANKPNGNQGNMMPAAAPDQPDQDIPPALITSILAMQPHQRVVALAAMPQPRFDAFLKVLKGPQRAALIADMTPDLKETVGALENPDKVVVEELMAQRLTRDIYAQTQLNEVMTDFWLNHFNVYLRKDEATPYYLVSYQRDVIRPNALGRFEDLLEAVAHSPAMMLYLDNASSIGPDSMQAEKAMRNAAHNGNNKPKPEGLNENYARELMELHTVGVNGGYTQADVIQAARILTGWTVDQPQRGGGFKFDPNRHEPGTKKVMGKKFKESGEQEGRDLLHFLATRPATAKFISRKIAVRFVSDDPPQSLVDRMAKTYLSTDGNIASVLETLYRSLEFWSPSVYRAKVKTPLEYVVSAARATNANLTSMQPLVNALRDMGMPLFGSIPPTGYKWDASDWVSTGELVDRMNFALSLAGNRLNGITVTWAPQQLDNAALISVPQNAPMPSPEAEESRLESMLVAGGVSGSTRTAVLEQFAAQSAQNQPPAPAPPPSSGNKSLTAAPAVFKPQPNHLPPPPPIEKQDQLLAGLLLGSPEFQRR